MPLCDDFYMVALDSWLAAWPAWAQLHVSDPGPRGELGGAVERRRVQVRWERTGPLEARSTNTLLWSEVAGIPGYPQRYTHLSLWSAAEGGMCWSYAQMQPMIVPHLATFEVPAGIIFNLPTWHDDQEDR